MCGIFGIFGAPLPPGADERIRALLKHRGPDDEGAVSFPEGGMGHTRLSIIDLSPSGRQPMSNAQGSVWVTYNGEIYNYLEIRKELSGYPFRTHTDTEVLLAAYETWGLDCLKRFRGMFAFGLWDSRLKRLICATDRFSIKPLYYHFDGKRLAFSSEVKPLALCGVRLTPNEGILYDYLASGLLDHTPQTLFEGVCQLRPGTFLIFERGQLQVGSYWRLEQEVKSEEADRSPTASDPIRERLEEALRLHLRGDVEVGLSLSSGLDSNLLRGLLLRVQNGSGPLRCFTYAFPGTPYDEWARCQSLRANGSCRYDAIEVTPKGFLQGLRDLILRMEGPVGGLGIYGYWMNAKLSSEQGIKVLLDGQGADEVFAGYRYYYEIKIRQLWDQGREREAEEEYRQLRQAHGEAEADFSSWLSARSSAKTAVLAPDSTSLESHYLHPEFSRRFEGRTHLTPEPFPCRVKNAMYRDLFFLKIPKLLRFQDRCAMDWSVEVRVPYLDHRLVEDVFSIPTQRLLQGGLTKSLLRQIARELVPDDLLRIPKLYVAAPQREWMKGVLSGPIRDMIRESVLAERGYILREDLGRQFEEYCRHPDLGNSFFIWKFLNLEILFRTFFS